MTEWSLSALLGGLHDDIQQKLATSRQAFAHPGTKGDASESVWLEMLQMYLPQRYRATKGHVVDSTGKFSDQIDVLVFDRQYSPFIFNYQGQAVIPAESVYAAFEAKAEHQRRASPLRKRQSRELPGNCIAPVFPFHQRAGLCPLSPCTALSGGCLPSRAIGSRHWESRCWRRLQKRNSFIDSISDA